MYCKYKLKGNWLYWLNGKRKFHTKIRQCSNLVTVWGYAIVFITQCILLLYTILLQYTLIEQSLHARSDNKSLACINMPWGCHTTNFYSVLIILKLGQNSIFKNDNLPNTWGILVKTTSDRLSVLAFYVNFIHNNNLNWVCKFIYRQVPYVWQNRVSVHIPSKFWDTKISFSKAIMPNQFRAFSHHLSLKNQNIAKVYFMTSSIRPPHYSDHVK